ncbi:MAG TPA: hypothetical protein VFU43_03500 [Streptosporangiaceae bacterium]|nr:hypothetical protein [Streptosporangiaceae bacterium]
MVVRSDHGGRERLQATAAELQEMAGLIQRYPAEAQLIMEAYEDGLTLGPMQVMDSDEIPTKATADPQDRKAGVVVTMDTRGVVGRLIQQRTHKIQQGDHSDFVEVTDEEKAAGRLNTEADHWGTLPAVQVAELLGVVHPDHASATPDDLWIEVDGTLARIIYEQAKFSEVFLHGALPEPRMPSEGTDAATLRALLAAVVDEVGALGLIGMAYRCGVWACGNDQFRRADLQGQAMAYKMAAIRIADALNKTNRSIEVEKHDLEKEF